METLSLEVPAWSIECGEHCPDRVVDIRQPETFHRGHLPGAVNVPYERFQLDALELLQGCGWALVVDSAGARAAEMAIWLRSRGQSAASLEGGMAAWRGQLERTQASTDSGSKE